MVSNNRRNFCQGCLASVGLSALPIAGLSTLVTAQTMALSSGSISSFSDGDMGLPVDFLYRDIPAAERDPLLAGSLNDLGVVNRPVNVNLLTYGNRKVLFDVGAGSNFLPSLGKLFEALEGESIDLSEITDVVFTHAHPDHIWGIIDDFDDLLMPEASYHIGKDEWAFWDSENALAAMPAGRKNFAVGAKSRFDLLRDRIILFSGGEEILPNIESVNSVGHTPGHMSFIVHDRDSSVLIAGDALTHEKISFERPEWPSSSDMDTDAAIKTRLKLLDQSTQDQLILAATHLPAPGFSRVEKADSAWRYVPI